MPDPTCDRCQQPLPNWQANLMVPKLDYLKQHRVDSLEIVCKACTAKLDKGGVRAELHNLWELAWAKSSFVWLLGEVLHDMQSQSHAWSREALDKFFQLAQLALPGMTKDPTQP